MTRRETREEKKTLFAYKHQEEVYKKLINDQLEYAYKQKFWRPPGDSDSDSDDDAPKRSSRSRSNFGGSVSGSSQLGGAGAKEETKPVMTNDGLGNTNMSMCLVDLNIARNKLFERVGKAIPKKKRQKRKKSKGPGDDNQSVFSVATTVNTEATVAGQPIFVGITEDYGWTMNKRQY